MIQRMKSKTIKQTRKTPEMNQMKIKIAKQSLTILVRVIRKVKKVKMRIKMKKVKTHRLHKIIRQIVMGKNLQI